MMAVEGCSCVVWREEGAETFKYLGNAWRERERRTERKLRKLGFIINFLGEKCHRTSVSEEVGS